MIRLTATELDAAHAAWGCNCAPAALAAILDLTLDEVRPLFGPGWPGYTNPTMMFAALRSSGRRWSWSSVLVSEQPPSWPRYGLARIQWHGPWMKPGVPIAARYRHTHWVGVAPLQPMSVSIDPDVALGHPVLTGTAIRVDWIAGRHSAGDSVSQLASDYGIDAQAIETGIAWHRGDGDTCIWDVNQMDMGGGWEPLAWWTSQTVSRLTAGIPRASGVWSLTHAIEVERW